MSYPDKALYLQQLMESRLGPAAPIDPSPPALHRPHWACWRFPSPAPGWHQTPESQPPFLNPYVLEQHPRLCNRWLGTAVWETLWETWMSTRRKTQIPRDFFLSEGGSYCLIFQEPDSRQALLLSHRNFLKGGQRYQDTQMVNRRCKVCSKMQTTTKKII